MESHARHSAPRGTPAKGSKTRMTIYCLTLDIRRSEPIARLHLSHKYGSRNARSSMLRTRVLNIKLRIERTIDMRCKIFTNHQRNYCNFSQRYLKFASKDNLKISSPNRPWF